MSVSAPALGGLSRLCGGVFYANTTQGVAQQASGRGAGQTTPHNSTSKYTNIEIVARSHLETPCLYPARSYEQRTIDLMIYDPAHRRRLPEIVSTFFLEFVHLVPVDFIKECMRSRTQKWGHDGLYLGPAGKSKNWMNARRISRGAFVCRFFHTPIKIARRTKDRRPTHLPPVLNA
jgi:hypothetical protein